ncbi:hypothetical protein P0082_09275 [Candidatus Haliotispira prima]|uniref:Uncharacterized protein n=1 Tax=Candidatus Haliotispira prima TaxID=3034016 RepID=A0ABY8MF99_9SPIO|nr:hypothetical protein P0082_09275 [Candidatus Haliotispira prima]
MACSDPPGSSDPDPGTSDPDPEEQTFTPSISWQGIRAVELQINTSESAAVAFIVRVASETAPAYADVETNIGLQSRLVTSGTHYFYTAMHHGSNQTLSANITAAAAGDYLTAGTAYKAYVFRDKKLVNTLDFSTLALPAAADWDETKLFIDGTFPYRDGIYQIDVQEGTVVLMSVYWKELIGDVVIAITPNEVFVAGCQPPTSGNTCAPDPGYAAESGFEHTTAAADTYFRLSFGIQQLATIDFVADNPVDNGIWKFRNGNGQARLVTVNMH